MANTNTRTFGKVEGNLRIIPSEFTKQAFRGDDLGGANLIYVAFARPGSGDLDPLWQIAFLTYSGTGNVISIQWPIDVNGSVSNDYEFVWNDRLTYSYV